MKYRAFSSYLHVKNSGKKTRALLVHKYLVQIRDGEKITDILAEMI